MSRVPREDAQATTARPDTRAGIHRLKASVRLRDPVATLAECRRLLADGRQELQRRYLARPQPERMLRAQAALVDRTLVARCVVKA